MTAPGVPGRDEVNRRIAERIEAGNRDKAWPWLQPGAVSVALDAADNVVEVRVAEDGTVTEHPLPEHERG